MVGWARRNFMVPLPRFASWDDFDAWLEMSELPPGPFASCEQATGQVSSQSLVRYQTNDYSVPVAYDHRDLWVRGVIGCGGEIIARHPRCYDREDMIFAPDGCG